MNDTSMRQETLPFKLGVTNDSITSRSGLVVFHEAALAAGVVAEIRRRLPTPGSNRGIRPEEYVMPLALMLTGGGRTMEDIREIARDTALRRLCRFRRLPGADAVARWLKAPRRLPGMKKVNEHLYRTIIARSDITEFTLDTDATLIETDKNTAKMCYKGFSAFAPLLSFLAELDLCVAGEFRNGNVPAGVGIVGQLKSTHKLLTSLGKRLRYFRSDSAGYQAEIINTCCKLGVKFTITADQDAAVKAVIRRAVAAGRWRRVFKQSGKRTDRCYATAVHCMEKTKAFTLVIQRWPNPNPDLFTQEPYCYQVIATNDDDRDPQKLIWFHNGRGDAENNNKEIKLGFGMDYMPCRNLRADSVWLELGILAHNLTVGVKRLLLGGEWATKTIATLRWQLISIAGKLVRHGRWLYLKVAADQYALLQSIRDRVRLLLTPT